MQQGASRQQCSDCEGNPCSIYMPLRPGTLYRLGFASLPLSHCSPTNSSGTCLHSVTHKRWVLLVPEPSSLQVSPTSSSSLQIGAATTSLPTAEVPQRPLLLHCHFLTAFKFLQSMLGREGVCMKEHHMIIKTHQHTQMEEKELQLLSSAKANPLTAQQFPSATGLGQH